MLPGGETVFMTAARTGRIEVVEALYEAGADVHFREPRRGQTALMWAAAEGNLEVVELLLEVGADPNATLDSGYTPLLFAVREGRMEVMEALLRAGVDVNAATPRKAVKRDRPLPGGRSVRPGSTPLLVAVTTGWSETTARSAATAGEWSGSGCCWLARLPPDRRDWLSAGYRRLEEVRLSSPKPKPSSSLRSA